jgi:hypothetical protein
MSIILKPVNIIVRSLLGKWENHSQQNKTCIKKNKLRTCNVDPWDNNLNDHGLVCIATFFRTIPHDIKFEIPLV